MLIYDGFMIYEFAAVLTCALIALKYDNIPLSLSLSLSLSFSLINQECIKEVMNTFSQSCSDWIEKGREAEKTCCSNFKASLACHRSMNLTTYCEHRR
jgi:hypothetical protein